MGAKTILTLEQFEQLPNEDDMQQELDEGELIVMPPPKPGHGRRQTKVASLLGGFVEKHSLGVVYTEVGFILQQDPWTVRAPDISFLKASRATLVARDAYIPGAPELAVEIVSEFDSAPRMMRKVNQYLRCGGHTVWVVYDELRQVHVFETAGTSRVLREDQILEAPELLPGFSIKVNDLFD
ncbi:MAG: Uma2 family endonuclease [Acidobacteria bacterium]|nr:Uma2 family endonuclease [Acidobacteriota bacterium]